MSVGDWLERRAGAARLVTHHEFLSSWQREGSLGVLAPVVLTHYRGRHRLGRAARAASREPESCGRARCSSEIWLVHQPLPSCAAARTGLLPALSCWLSMGRSTMLTLVVG